jgi:hypothetical protein
MGESAQTGGLTPKRDWVEPFLSALASFGVVTYACKQAKVSRPSAYERKASDPEFAARWQDAIEQAVENLEAEANRRARVGYLRPVYQKGELVGKVREYSDTLLIFLLKGLKPQVYRDPQPGGGESLLAELVRGLVRGDVAERKAAGGQAQPPGETGGDGPAPGVADPAAPRAD